MATKYNKPKLELSFEETYIIRKEEHEGKKYGDEAILGRAVVGCYKIKPLEDLITITQLFENRNRNALDNLKGHIDNMDKTQLEKTNFTKKHGSWYYHSPGEYKNGD